MKMLLSRIPPGVRKTGIYASALVLTKLTALAMLPVFTHFLTPADYGRLDILQTLANLLSIVIGFGLADTLFRFVGAAEDEAGERETAATVFGLAIAVSTVSLFATQLAAPMIAEVLPGSVSELQTRLILASLSLTGIILVPLSWFRLRDRAFRYFNGSAGRAVGQAVLVSLFLGLGFGIDGVLFAGFLCAATLALIVGFIQFRDTGVSFNWGRMLAQGRFGGVLVIAGIASFVLDSCDRWFLAGTIGVEALAEYALAAKIGIMAAFLTQPFEMWWLPKRFTTLRVDGPVACARATEIGLVVAMVSAIGISGGGALAVTLLTPNAYHGAVVYVPVLGGLAALNAATLLINTGVLSEQKTTKPIWIDGTAAGVAVLGYITLIPAMGVWGAIWATVAALVLRFCLYLVVGQRRQEIPYRWARLAGPLSITIACIIACSQVQDMWLSFGIGAIAGSAVLALSALLKLLPLSADAVFGGASVSGA